MLTSEEREGILTLIAALKSDRTEAEFRAEIDATAVENGKINELVDGTRLLWVAARRNKIEATKHLIEVRRVNIDAPDGEGQTPLMTACTHEYMEVIKYLLDKGANIEAKDKHNGTALFYAVQLYVHRDKTITTLRVANYLLERGADVRTIGLKDPEIACAFFKEMCLKPVTRELTSFHTNFNPQKGRKRFLGHLKIDSGTMALSEADPISDNATEQEVYQHLSDVWVQRFGDDDAQYSDPKVAFFELPFHHMAGLNYLEAFVMAALTHDDPSVFQNRVVAAVVQHLWEATKTIHQWNTGLHVINLILNFVLVYQSHNGIDNYDVVVTRISWTLILALTSWGLSKFPAFQGTLVAVAVAIFAAYWSNQWKWLTWFLDAGFLWVLSCVTVALLNVILAVLFVAKIYWFFRDTQKRAQFYRLIQGSAFYYLLDGMQILVWTMSIIEVGRRLVVGGNAMEVFTVGHALTIVMLWMKLLYFLRPYPFAGHIVKMFIAIMNSILPFMAVIMIILAGFAQALHLVSEGESTFGHPFYAIVQTVIYNMGDASYDHDFTTLALVIAMVWTVTIVLLNLLIAFMNDIYSEIDAKKAASVNLEKASVILDHSILAWMVSDITAVSQAKLTYEALIRERKYRTTKKLFRKLAYLFRTRQLDAIVNGLDAARGEDRPQSPRFEGNRKQRQDRREKAKRGVRRRGSKIVAFKSVPQDVFHNISRKQTFWDVVVAAKHKQEDDLFKQKLKEELESNGRARLEQDLKANGFMWALYKQLESKKFIVDVFKKLFFAPKCVFCLRRLTECMDEEAVAVNVEVEELKGEVRSLNAVVAKVNDDNSELKSMLRELLAISTTTAHHLVGATSTSASAVTFVGAWASSVKTLSPFTPDSQKGGLSLIEFEEMEVPGDGNCILHCLGITRAAAVEMLLQACKKSIAHNDVVGKEVQDWYGSKDTYLVGDDGEYDNLVVARNLACAEFNSFCESHNLNHTSGSIDGPNDINGVAALGADDEDLYWDLKDAKEEAEEAVEDYYYREDVVIKFIQNIMSRSSYHIVFEADQADQAVKYAEAATALQGRRRGLTKGVSTMSTERRERARSRHGSLASDADDDAPRRPITPVKMLLPIDESEGSGNAIGLRAANHAQPTLCNDDQNVDKTDHVLCDEELTSQHAILDSQFTDSSNCNLSPDPIDVKEEANEGAPIATGGDSESTLFLQRPDAGGVLSEGNVAAASLSTDDQVVAQCSLDILAHARSTNVIVWRLHQSGSSVLIRVHSFEWDETKPTVHLLHTVAGTLGGSASAAGCNHCNLLKSKFGQA